MLRPQLMRHAMLRAAAWPIETVQIFSAPHLAVAARAVIASESIVLQHREATIEALYNLIPAVGNKRTRAHLLALKRRLYTTTLPLPRQSADIESELVKWPKVAMLLKDETRIRMVLAQRRAAFEESYANELARQQVALRDAASTLKFQ